MFPVGDGHLQGCDASSMARTSGIPPSWPPEVPLAVGLMSLPSTDVAMRKNRHARCMRSSDETKTRLVDLLNALEVIWYLLDFFFPL